MKFAVVLKDQKDPIFVEDGVASAAISASAATSITYVAPHSISPGSEGLFRIGGATHPFALFRSAEIIGIYMVQKS